MAANLLLSKTFRSIKPHNPNPNPKSSTPSPLQLSPSSAPSSSSSTTASAKSKSKPWSVYLILSTNAPIKTYVGVTTDFHRRLRQHNGELKGGAKASRAGRPWVCACVVQGFNDQNEACQFESKWKSCSKTLHRKRVKMEEEQGKKASLLLQHRRAALDRVRGSIICSHLNFNWQLDPS